MVYAPFAVVSGEQYRMKKIIQICTLLFLLPMPFNLFVFEENTEKIHDRAVPLSGLMNLEYTAILHL